jgi:hypothetical protein
MERLVIDLPRLARLDAGQEPFEHVPCSLATIADMVTAELEPMRDARRQHIVRSMPDEALTVDGDPAKLFDILRNRVENALKHGPEGSRILVGARPAGDRIHLSVEDEGPGIPEADLPRVFEPFYQVDKSRTRSTRPRWHGARPRHRQAPAGAAPRPRPRRQPPGRRRAVHGGAAGTMTPSAVHCSLRAGPHPRAPRRVSLRSRTAAAGALQPSAVLFSLPLTRLTRARNDRALR